MNRKTIAKIVLWLVAVASSGLTVNVYLNSKAQAKVFQEKQSDFVQQQLAMDQKMTALQDQVKTEQAKRLITEAEIANLKNNTDVAQAKVAEAKVEIAQLRATDTATLQLLRDLTQALQNFSNAKATGSKKFYIDLAITIARQIMEQKLAK